MIFTAIRRPHLLIIIFLVFSSPCPAQEEYLARTGIIHIHSVVSEKGSYFPERLVNLAQDKGIKILVFCDSFLRRWEYGLPVFSNILKASIQERSVVKYGIKRYLEYFKKIKDEFPDMLILEGVEVSPFYWWSGNLFKKNLSLNDWNRHLLVIGLKKHQDYAHLPVLGNRYFLPQLKDIPPLSLPISLIILGIFILKKRKPRKFLGLILTGVGILFLFNLFPFSASTYDSYHGQKKFLPYQDLIDYVNKRGGLVFWAHPEMTELTSQRKFIRIGYYTPSYPESLILTSAYTGFGVNMSPGASHDLILAGGEWDKVLMGYCEGKRNQPVWAIGEADYYGQGKIDSVQNIFFLHKFKPESVFEALRKGRIYIRYYSENSIDISLTDFHIEDSKEDVRSKYAFIADEIEVEGKPRLRIKGTINPAQDLNIEIIRNGEIIKKFEFTNEKVFDLEFQDDSSQVLRKKSYYRLNFFADRNVILLTNPIFVKIKHG